MDAAELDFWADEAKRIADARRSD
ncbi:hypothetical protein CCR84_12630 [Rhodocyclus purpureus]|nr:hypothetical protein [Rhodocyclus purpureus]